MKKVIAFVLAAALSTGVMAQSFQTVVEDANCVQIGQNTSMTGAAVGGGVGAVGGALVGSLFGKKGKWLGAAAGALGGAAIGSNGDKVYNCTILTTVGNERIMVSKQTNAPVERGTAVTVLKQNGQWQAL
ncbi:hypothetical protein PHABIO_346 [Pseudomonas phage Phabio]|uniref:YMGG-like Gly-zipper domain-containing protein n=1 Tax=Pseudomonas phage Phabio TaxID=2006668 RepID=A0A1Y0T294_9CAUD|nr:hypothetical protein MZD05_gp346 [Pseudomonas phage Phabio]ARV76977.1 hypothetical protein PHABIO_346 [Pseudomonas phage Phabio]